jgi:hypothetical protein
MDVLAGGVTKTVGVVGARVPVAVKVWTTKKSAALLPLPVKLTVPPV